MRVFVVTKTNGHGAVEHVAVPETCGVMEHSCGVQLFHLNDNGTVSCPLCQKPLQGFSWNRVDVQ